MEDNNIDTEYRDALIEYSNYLNKYDAYMKALRETSIIRWKDKIDEFCSRRKFSRELIDKLGIFYIDNMAEMMQPEFIPELKMFGVISETNNKPIYSGRYVIPIKATNGSVVNSVGYMWGETTRYMYATGEYYSRADTLYGLENINKAYELGWAIVVEGITDCIALRDIGYENVFAWCGTRASDVKLRILNRCKYGAVFIKDRDSAGDMAAKKWVTNRYINLNIPLIFKDTDEFLNKSENKDERAYYRELMKERLQACEAWLLQREHNGLKCGSVETTIFI